MTKDKWEPINDHPGDQLYDNIPGTADTSYWGEIGEDGRPHTGPWSWSIMAKNGDDQWEEDNGYADTEAAAKAAVEGWRPR